MRGFLRLPNGEEVSCSFGYIDETGGIAPKLAKVIAAARKGKHK